MSIVEQGWGLDVVLWFQSWRTPFMETYGRVFHFFGRENFFLILLPLIYWCINARWGRRLLPLFLISVWSNLALKSLLHRPRPYTVSPQVNNLVEESTYGFPSGDAQSATVIAGTMALNVRRRWFTALMVLYVLLVMMGRVVIGVHFPQDVIGGMLLGLVVLACYTWLEPRISIWLERQTLWQQIAVVVLTAVAMLIVHPVLIEARSIPEIENVGTVIGVFLGGRIGLVLEVQFVSFEAGGAWWKRLARLLVGLTAALALRFGLGAAFEGLQPEMALRIVRYAVIGLWITFGAPWAFVKMGLARKYVR